MLSLDSEVAKSLRTAAMEKYGNTRSMSRYIEELATGAAQIKEPDACSILGVRSEYSFKAEKNFNESVALISEHIKNMNKKIELNRDELHSCNDFFEMKEAFELMLNKRADYINECWSCKGYTEPMPKYESAGKNYALFASMYPAIR